MRPTLEFPVVPLDDMQNLRTIISMESISMAGVKNALSNLLPSLRGNFDMFARKFTTKEPTITLAGNERDFIKLVMAQNYLNITGLPVHIPEGLTVGYMEYVAALDEAVEHCAKNTLDSLNKYSLFLSQIITNREFKHTVGSHTKSLVNQENDRKALTDRINKCFNQTTVATSTYGDVVSRNSEWQHIFETLNHATAAVNRISRDALHKKAEECNQLLEVIIKQIKNGLFDEAGPEVTTNLSEGAYQAAAEMEFFSVVYYKTMTVNTALSDTIKEVTDAIKSQ